MKEPKGVGYNPGRIQSDGARHGGRRGGPPLRGESIALLILAGTAMGAGFGYLIDWLVGTVPLFVVIGVFAGFALALYAIYLETK